MHQWADSFIKKKNNFLWIIVKFSNNIKEQKLPLKDSNFSNIYGGNKFKILKLIKYFWRTSLNLKMNCFISKNSSLLSIFHHHWLVIDLIIWEGSALLCFYIKFFFSFCYIRPYFYSFILPIFFKLNLEF